MKGKRFELEVDSKLESLPIVSDSITKVLKGIGADERSIFEVQMAVDQHNQARVFRGEGTHNSYLRVGG
jgi:hypothetical protein